nr:cell division protein ZapA [uncultured Ruminococcus sp.]
MEKKKISVQIEGRNYSLITTDDEKYVHKVANEVVSHIRKVAQSTKQLDTRDCAILAALNFCDDRNKAVKKNKDYVEKADKIIQQTNELNRLCKEYRDKLTESMNDNTRLTMNNRELEKRIAVLRHEVDQLRNKLEENNGTSKTSEKSEKGQADKKEKSEIKKDNKEQSKEIPVNVLSNEAKKTEEELRNEELLGYVPMKQYSLFDEEKK